jgi:hypothetical protein
MARWEIARLLPTWQQPGKILAPYSVDVQKPA